MGDVTGNAPAGDSGNAEVAPETGNAASAPAVTEGGNAAPELTREMVQGSEYFKELQGSFTKRSQRLKEIEAQNQQYQKALQDPLSAGISETDLRRYLNMKGYDMQKLNTQQENDMYGESQVPQDARILQHLGPMQERINRQQEQLNNMVHAQVITELNDNFKDWEKYEDDIKSTLAQYPHLGQTKEGIAKLYDLCVPVEKKEAAILERIQNEQRQKAELGNTVQPAGAKVKAEIPDISTAGDMNASWDLAKKTLGIGDSFDWHKLK
jgi:hypothetical protein